MKHKTILSQHLRLKSELQIYWDKLDKLHTYIDKGQNRIDWKDDSSRVFHLQCQVERLIGELEDFTVFLTLEEQRNLKNINNLI
jgi:hypothetical protein